MPWDPKDAKRHTKKANTAKKGRQWSDVANSVLKRGGGEGSAIRQANAVAAGTAKHGAPKFRKKRAAPASALEAVNQGVEDGSR
ncbi:MAG TPA: hypothetical protein VE907_06280 [Gammaproteobacteria bacterium]|nr:hypothetical protein [Gammaproteobacteria bacterium]